jgi:hypothetical protein
MEIKQIIVVPKQGSKVDRIVFDKEGQCVSGNEDRLDGYGSPDKITITLRGSKGEVLTIISRRNGSITGNADRVSLLLKDYPNEKIANLMYGVAPALPEDLSGIQENAATDASAEDLSGIDTGDDGE